MVTLTEWHSANTWERDTAAGHSMMPGAARSVQQEKDDDFEVTE